MKVITRHKHQSILVGDSVEVMVVGLDGGLDQYDRRCRILFSDQDEDYSVNKDLAEGEVFTFKGFEFMAVRIRSNKLRLGVTAPASVKILRRETTLPPVDELVAEVH